MRKKGGRETRLTKHGCLALILLHIPVHNVHPPEDDGDSGPAGDSLAQRISFSYYIASWSNIKRMRTIVDPRLPMLRPAPGRGVGPDVDGMVCYGRIGWVVGVIWVWQILWMHQAGLRNFNRGGGG